MSYILYLYKDTNCNLPEDKPLWGAKLHS